MHEGAVKGGEEEDAGEEAEGDGGKDTAQGGEQSAGDSRGYNHRQRKLESLIALLSYSTHLLRLTPVARVSMAELILAASNADRRAVRIVLGRFSSCSQKLIERTCCSVGGDGVGLLALE